MSRNFVLATGTGVTDDHGGEDWTGQQWRHVTGVWATSTDVPDLQYALRAGRAWFYDPAAYTGTLDLVGAGFVPMGSAGVVSADKSTLKIHATSVPANWNVVVVSGIADEAGPSQSDPAVKSRSYPASDVVNGSLKVTVSSGVSKFFRVMLRDASGNIHAYSNPLWLLRSVPYTPVPEQRRAKRASPSPTMSVTASDDPTPSPSDATTTDREPTDTETITTTDTATETATETTTETAMEDPPPP
jgi:hypothetical protein